MADKIYINTEIYAQLTSRLENLSCELSECAASLSRVDTNRDAGGTLRVNLGSRLSSIGASLPSGQIASCVRSLRQVIQAMRDHTGALADNVRQAVKLFESVEKELTGKEIGASNAAAFSEGGAPAAAAGVAAAHAGAQRVNVTEQVITDGDVSAVISEGIAELVIGGVRIAAWAGNLLNPGSVSLIAPFGPQQPLIGDPNALRESFENSPFTSLSDLFPLDGSVQAEGSEDVGRNDRESTSALADRLSIGAFSVGTGAANSAWSVEKFVSSGNATFIGTADALKAEGEIGASAGLYAVETSADGNTTYKLSPGAEARIGGSVSAFEVGASANYELIDFVDTHASVTGTAGQATADVEAKIGIVDGELNLYAGAELEAIAGEIKGDIGIDVAGVDATVSASLNYGIGVHAEAGLDDGVLKVDIGASLGVGASLGFELDVTEALENAAEAISGLSSRVWDFFT